MKPPQELRDEIQSTLIELKQLIKEIEQTTDPKEQRRLTRKLREMQYLQLWWAGLLRSVGESVWPE